MSGWRLRFQKTRDVLDERWLWVTPCVPDVDDEGNPAIVDDRLLPVSEQDEDEWEERRNPPVQGPSL